MSILIQKNISEMNQNKLQDNDTCQFRSNLKKKIT